MVFANDNNDAPFYLKGDEIISHRYDVFRKEQPKNMNKDELKEILQQHSPGINTKLNKKKLQQLCSRLGLPFKKPVSIFREGWVDKPKGMFQILWERGWIDPNNISKYTTKGTKDSLGIRDETSSLEGIMKLQPDFLEQETLLQYYGRMRGIQVVRTPKCHPELAGEGIEYVWGAAKLYYRNASLSLKRTKEGFEELVQKCTDSSDNGILNRELVRKCAARARRYMLAYLAISAAQEGENNDETKVTYSLIEKCVKMFKAHRSAADFDNAFIKSIVQQMWRQTTLTVDIMPNV